MVIQEGHYDCAVLSSSGGLRRRGSAKPEDKPVGTRLHKLPSANEEVQQPISRYQQRACNDEDAVLDCRVSRTVSDPGEVKEEDATASPSATGVLGRFASLSAAAINSRMPRLPLLRGFSTPAKHVQSVQADSASSSSSTSDTTQQQHGRDQYTHEHLAKQDAAATAILLAGDCDATQAAARRHTTAAGAREPQHLISASSSASSDDSCKLHDALAGQAAAEAAGADLACSGYMDSAVPAASLGVPGARLLLATAVGVGKGTYKFKSDKDPKKSD